MFPFRAAHRELTLGRRREPCAQHSLGSTPATPAPSWPSPRGGCARHVLGEPWPGVYAASQRGCALCSANSASFCCQGDYEGALTIYDNHVSAACAVWLLPALVTSSLQGKNPQSLDPVLAQSPVPLILLTLGCPQRSVEATVPRQPLGRPCEGANLCTDLCLSRDNT